MEGINIADWDVKVKQRFQQMREQLPILQQEYDMLLKVLKGDLSPEERQPLQERIRQLEQIIPDLENNSSLSYYLFEVPNFLELYETLAKNVKPRSFLRTKESIRQEEIANGEIRKNCENYLNMIRQYNHILQMDIPHLKSLTTAIVCVCGNREFEVDDGRIFFCNKCGTQVKEKVVQRTANKTDNKTKSNNSIREAHMRNCILQVQGKQKVNIPDQLIQDCVKYISDHHIKEYYPTEVRDILRKTGWKDQYENANLIWSILRKRNCPDFSALEGAILEDFVIIQKTYDEIIEENKEVRKSFMNYPFTLYHILTRRGYRCDLRFFHMLKEERIDWLNGMMKKIFSRLNWNGFKPLSLI